GRDGRLSIARIRILDQVLRFSNPRGFALRVAQPVDDRSSALVNAVSIFARYGSTSGAKAGCLLRREKWLIACGNSSLSPACTIGARPLFASSFALGFSLKNRASSATKQMSAIVTSLPTRNWRPDDNA